MRWHRNLNCWGKTSEAKICCISSTFFCPFTESVLYCKFTGFTIVILFPPTSFFSCIKKRNSVTSSKALTLREKKILKTFFRSQKIYTSIRFSQSYFYQKHSTFSKLNSRKTVFTETETIKKTDWKNEVARIISIKMNFFFLFISLKLY